MRSRRDCFDWPERPQLQGALSAQAPASPAQDVAGATPVPGDEGFATLLTLAALILAPVTCCYVAWLLIEALTRSPILFVFIGAAVLFGGLIAWALCKAAAMQPWRLEDDDVIVLTSLFERRVER